MMIEASAEVFNTPGIRFWQASDEDWGYFRESVRIETHGHASPKLKTHGSASPDISDYSDTQRRTAVRLYKW